MGPSRPSHITPTSGSRGSDSKMSRAASASKSLHLVASHPCAVSSSSPLSPCGFPDHGSSKLLPSSSIDPVWSEAQVSFGRQPPPPTPPEEPQPVTRHSAEARLGSVLSSCPKGLCLHLLGTLPDAMPTKWGRGSILSCDLTCCWLSKEQSI